MGDETAEGANLRGRRPIQVSQRLADPNNIGEIQLKRHQVQRAQELELQEIRAAEKALANQGSNKRVASTLDQPLTDSCKKARTEGPRGVETLDGLDGGKSSAHNTITGPLVTIGVPSLRQNEVDSMEIEDQMPQPHSTPCLHQPLAESEPAHETMALTRKTTNRGISDISRGRGTVEASRTGPIPHRKKQTGSTSHKANPNAKNDHSDSEIEEIQDISTTKPTVVDRTRDVDHFFSPTFKRNDKH
ncbi:hypothetical protein H0H92_014803, partial [Tricholoma furcatifolium]